MSFVHLHCHSEYSILECPNRIKSLVQKAVEFNMPALALTDNATMYGAIQFYQHAKQAGINPILGADLYITSDMSEKQRWQQRLVVLAKSYKGYQNLIKLISKAHLDGFYYKPRLDLATCAQHAEDLIAISPGNRGPIAFYLQAYQDPKAKEVASFLNQHFDQFYLGVQRAGNPHESLIEDGTKTLSETLNIPIVAMNEVYYMEPEDSMLRDVMFCIQTGKRLDDAASAKFQNNELYFKSPQAMNELFSDHPEWIENSVQIAAQCQLDIEMEQVLLPHFKCPDNKSSESYLEELVWDGINHLYPSITQEIKDRVSFELDIITKMKYPNYFLIIYDFLSYCTQSKIPVGPGRGSAAGSIVAFALGITKLDPIKYNLLFERFLNPDRISMPDIDIDFCIKRRSEVIDYIVDHYGQDCVSQIITFGTMQARAVIRDVGRALDVPLSDVDRIAKLIPSTPGSYTSIPDALDQISELKQAYDNQDGIKELLDIGIKLEGITRHTSTHAAGVVISRDPLSTVVPLTQNDGQIATQYAMADIEQIGLLKMDILGLRNLTVLDDCESFIQQHSNPSFVLDTICIDDQKTFDMLADGLGVGIFQLESRGMRQLMKDMKPEVFEDVIALLALFRPGPLGSGMVNDFISNKLGTTTVSYPIDALEPILNETYGMIVYQEQVMQIASVIGGFSLAEADMLRRAMGKKKKDVMDKMRKQFLHGAEKNNHDLDKAANVFELCYKFAEYGFNKSHSTAYALISYQTAFLKANYTVEYMAALLSSVVSNSDKTASYIQECLAMNIEVMPPSINGSKKDFTIETNPNSQQPVIRFGLGAIKNVGDGAIESIITEAPFTSLVDFCMRVDLKHCNKRVLESLIKAGAIDDFGERSYLLAIFEWVMEKAIIHLKEKENGQISMFSNNQVGSGFSIEELHTDDYHVFSPSEQLKMEKEMIGLYISGHPLEALKNRIKDNAAAIQHLNDEHNHKIVHVTGMLSNCRRLMTRNKKEMLTGTLEDLSGSLSVFIFFDDDFEKKSLLFQDDNVVTVTGRFRLNQDNASIACQQLVLLDKLDMPKSFYIDAEGLDNDTLAKIKSLNLQFKGTFPVYFKVADKTIQAHQKFWVVEDALYQKQIENIIGPGRIWST